MRDNPCHGCVAPKRHIGCHGSCKDYKDWKAEWDERQKVIRAQRRADQQLIDDARMSDRNNNYRRLKRR